VQFEVVDIMADPEGMTRLMAFGVRNVPVVSRGKEYVFGQVLADVARLAGVKPPGQAGLTPAQMVERWLFVLTAAQRFVRQLPTDYMEERAIANRDRSVRYMAFHVFRIGEALLEVTQGEEMTVERPNVPPGDHLQTGDQIAVYGDDIIRRITAWWGSVADPTCAGKVPTYYGMQPMRDVLERCTWHSAQHVRQLMVILERLNIAPDTPVTDKDLAGLPMPKGVWE
jgi:hypothetical protein